jgi:hypothetical protein
MGFSGIFCGVGWNQLKERPHSCEFAMNVGVEALIALLAGSGTTSAVVSTLLSYFGRGRRKEPRIELEFEHSDGTSVTAVLKGVDDTLTEQWIRALETQAIDESSQNTKLQAT